MKVSTIEEIHKVLKSQAEATNAIYLNFREELRERYSTRWFNSRSYTLLKYIKNKKGNKENGKIRSNN